MICISPMGPEGTGVNLKKGVRFMDRIQEK